MAERRLQHYNDWNKTERLYLGDNVIEKLEANTFQGLSSLRFLALNNNFLKDIKTNAFKGLKSLKKLYLQNNHLSTLECNVFDPLDFFTTISTGTNENSDSFLTPGTQLLVDINSFEVLK